MLWVLPLGHVVCESCCDYQPVSAPCSDVVCNPAAEQDRHGSSSPELLISTSIPDSDVETALIDAGSFIVCVCVCVRERERERERVCVGVCVCRGSEFTMS